jgi:hypothetical protein
MTKQLHADVLDGSLNAIRNVATKMMLISGYNAGDSYATVTAAALATVTVAPTDFTLASAGSNRTLTTATKSATATAASPAIVATRAATGGSTTTLVDSTQAWATNDKAGKIVTAVAGAGAGQKALIVSNTTTTLSFGALGAAFDATTTYRINNNHHIAFTDGSAKVLWVTDETGDAAVSIGDTVNFPALLLTNPQPA